MNIKQRENIEKFSGQKEVFGFDEKTGKLSETAELLQVPNLKQKLWKTLRHAASHQQQVGKHSQYVESTQDREVEGKGNCSIEEIQLNGGHMHEDNNSGGGSDHLLILAHSAELMLESDSADGLLENDQNHEGIITPIARHLSEIVSHVTVTDHKSPGKQVEETPVIGHLRNDGDGFGWGGKTPRLSQIRCQARSKSNLLLKQRIGEPTVGHLQGRRIRLTQIRHQARSKNPSQKYSSGNLQGIVRLSELRRQARSKCNSPMREAIQDHVHGHLDCQTYKDQRKRIIADIFGEEDGSKAVKNEVDKLISGRGSAQSSQLRCKARLGHASTLDKDSTENNSNVADKGLKSKPLQ